MNLHRSIKTSLARAIFGSALASLVASSSTSGAQTLDELKQLPAYQKLTGPTSGSKGNHSQSSNALDRNTNFGSLWLANRNAYNLLSWLQIKIPGYRAAESAAGLNEEYAGAQATVWNKENVSVRIDILIPRVEYATMAQFNTLRSFNQFRPPTLNVIAEQVIPIQGIDANYYRTEKGECSLLLKVERLGIVNLAINRCGDSKVMMDVAKQLNFARLNQKLLS